MLSIKRLLNVLNAAQKCVKFVIQLLMDYTDALNVEHINRYVRGLKMSDVWRELMERLKQKAKTLAQIVDMRDSEVKKVASDASIYNRRMLKWMLSKWVKLEDVLSELRKLQQNAPDRGHLLNSLRSQRIEKARQAVCFDCPYYDDCEAGTSCFERFLKELIKNGKES